MIQSIFQIVMCKHCWEALPLPRRDSKSGKWAGIPSSDQKVPVVEARTLPNRMDVRRTHDMHGERISVDHQQHDVEPPPNDVVNSRNH